VNIAYIIPRNVYAKLISIEAALISEYFSAFKLLLIGYNLGSNVIIDVSYLLSYIENTGKMHPLINADIAPKTNIGKADLQNSMSLKITEYFN